MTKVISSLGAVVDFDKLKIQQSLEDAKNNQSTTAPVVGRNSKISAEQLGMGPGPAGRVKEGLVTLNPASDTTTKKKR